MVNLDELFSAVDAAFEVTARGLSPWQDPHPDRQQSTDQEESSRWTDLGKWRIVGARADAWIQALVEAGLANVETDAVVSWQTPPRFFLGRTDRLTPTAAGAIPLIVARTGIGLVKVVGDERVVLGAGDPAICIVDIPDCGCDACDSGSQDVLDELDHYVLGVVSGAFRRLSSGAREITVFGDFGGPSRRAAGGFRRGEVDTILDDPAGWDELSGTSWLDGDGIGPTS